jgi:hypothetical protein
MTKHTPKITKALIQEYGEQTYRDYKSRRDAYKKYGKANINGNFPNKRPTYEDAAWSSVYVAWGCGFITEKQQKTFLKAIIKYAKETKFPKNFI